MSIIKNTTLPARHSQLVSADLNTVFTETNTAFPMDGSNVRNEGLDQPQFNLDPNDGAAGLVLKKSEHFGLGHGTGTIVPANTAATPPFDPFTEVQSTGAILTQIAQNDIFRVYFQVDAEVTGNNSTPLAASTNGVAWAFWLQWDITSPALTNWEAVPNNSEELEDILVSPATYGAQTNNMYGTMLVSHTYIHEKSSSTVVDFPPRRGHRGTWQFLADQSYNVYGLRILARGLFLPFYSVPASIGDPDAHNSIKLVLAASASHQIKVYNSDITYVQMRNV